MRELARDCTTLSECHTVHLDGDGILVTGELVKVNENGEATVLISCALLMEAAHEFDLLELMEDRRD